jgi:hypothetical protein
VERKRPGVGKPLVLPGVGIAYCRAFPGVADIGEGYMSSGRMTLSEVVIIAVIRVEFAAIARLKVRMGIQARRSHHMTRVCSCHNRVRV